MPSAVIQVAIRTRLSKKKPETKRSEELSEPQNLEGRRGEIELQDEVADSISSDSSSHPC